MVGEAKEILLLQIVKGPWQSFSLNKQINLVEFESYLLFYTHARAHTQGQTFL